MRQFMNVNVMFVFLLLAVVFPARQSLCKPPPHPDNPAPTKLKHKTVRLQTAKVALSSKEEIRWDLERNFASGRRAKAEAGYYPYRFIPAVDVTELDQKQKKTSRGFPPSNADKETLFGVWSKKFDDPDLKYRNGYSSVVDEKCFTDLRTFSGQSAKTLNREAIRVGRIKLKKFQPVHLVHFLVSSGIVDANLHIMATVTGTYYESDAGSWFSLNSSDPYWTNKQNHAYYSFAIYISREGEIFVMNRSDVGRLPDNAVTAGKQQ